MLCCDRDVIDTTPPTVQITTIFENSTVLEIVKIECNATDNVKLDRLELWIDSSFTGSSVFAEPYIFYWNTLPYTNHTQHTVNIRAYDSSNNYADSDPISLIINNELSYPDSVSVNEVTYTIDSLTVSWDQIIDSDYDYHQLLHSYSLGGEMLVVEDFTDRNINQFSIYDFNPTIENWFWIRVTDTLGFTSVGDGMSNEIELPPQASDLHEFIYENDSLYISWEQNFDQDFVSYSLYASNHEDMLNEYITVSIENSMDTTFSIPFDEGLVRYFRLEVKDQWELTSVSDTLEFNSQIKFVKLLDYEGGYRPWGEQTSDGGYIIIGPSEEIDTTVLKTNYIFKTDSYGEIEWTKGIKAFVFHEVKQTTDGGFIISGIYMGELLLVKIDPYGNVTWTYILEESFLTGLPHTSVLEVKSGGYVVAGGPCSLQGIGVRTVLVKVNANGVQEWSQVYDDSAYIAFPINRCLAAASDGGFIMAIYDLVEWDEEGLIKKTDSYGNEEWTQFISTNDIFEIHSICQALDGGFHYFASLRNGNSILIKTDMFGNEEWTQSFYDVHIWNAKTLNSWNEEGFILTGSKYSIDSESTDFVLIKTDMLGNLVWEKTYGSEGAEYAFSVDQTNDGGFLMSGYNGSQIIIKTDHLGNTLDFPE